MLTLVNVVKYSSPTFGYIFQEEFITNLQLYFLAVVPLTAAATRTKSVFIWAAAARGGASFRSADAAQVCSNVDFAVHDGAFECSVAIAARQIVSERW